MKEATADPSQPLVLVVDDDEIMRAVARESLTEEGFQVTEADNGIRALAALESLRPDIILLDVMMPEMDGFDTAQAIRRLPGYELVPILIMTALDDLESIQRAYQVGATDFITKPINWVILVQRVRYMTRAVKMMNEQKRLEKELQQAQKLEAVATLAGGVAHDFNNLLQTIQGSSELLMLDIKKDNPCFSQLIQIRSAAERGGELTRQLLTYSRKIESQKRPVHLNIQARQVHRLLERTIPKMIDIDLRLAKDLHQVNADAVQMEQVLMNLAINARDAMPDGGQLIIETANAMLPENHGADTSKSAPRKGVMLSVTDTGHGMDAKTHEKIFEPFFSTKAPGKGTGLGLSMVHGIVRNHDGRITCHSEPGKGTCFHIYLPALDSVPEEKPIEDNAGCPGGDETLLLVDDDDVIRDSCKERLEKAGYTVLTATGGEKAVEVYRQRAGNIALVLLDLIMPGMGGIKCLQTLLQIDPAIKIIIVSGYASNDPAMQAIEACANAYLRKPHSDKQLLATIRSVLDRDQPMLTCAGSPSLSFA